MVESAADENCVSNFGLGKSGEMSSTLSQKNHVHLIHHTILSTGNIQRQNHESTGDADAGHAAPFQLLHACIHSHTPGAQLAVSHSVLLKFLLSSSLQTSKTCATNPPCIHKHPPSMR